MFAILLIAAVIFFVILFRRIAPFALLLALWAFPAAAAGPAIDYWALFAIKGICFLLAIVMIVLLLGLFRWTVLQRLVLPFFDGVSRMEARADDGETGAQIAIGVAHGLATAAILLSAAMLAGVAH